MDLSEFYETKPKPCLFSRSTKDLNKEDKEKLEAAMAELDIPVMSIHNWLQKRNVKVSCPTIRRHRKKECDCGKDA
jgi:hypothetical protein